LFFAFGPGWSRSSMAASSARTALDLCRSRSACRVRLGTRLARDAPYSRGILPYRCVRPSPGQFRHHGPRPGPITPPRRCLDRPPIWLPGTKALDELESAQTSVGGTGPDRRYATQQINQAYAVLVASQFQGFCRDLHTECVARLMAFICVDLCAWCVESVARNHHGFS